MHQKATDFSLVNTYSWLLATLLSVSKWSLFSLGAQNTYEIFYNKDKENRAINKEDETIEYVKSKRMMILNTKKKNLG